MRKPWGNYFNLVTGGEWLLKKITVDPNEMISLQLHGHRDEIWIIVEGKGLAQLGDYKFPIKPFEVVRVSKNKKHRIINNTEDPLVLIELQYGDIIDEDDVKRFDDKYGRE
jgi:mannose-6-phosphate isomerase-like protein (cupin superfamily)